MAASTQSTSTPTPPPIGTLIDNGALELVDVLGYGGYGIVYRAVDTYSSHPISYAVKCLHHSTKRNATRQRQLHIREIALHQLASAHPGVVTLHRVIEDHQYTWIVMDYCPDGDLFTQILHNRRYLGNNDLIREVFLQLLDAVEYCHSLNIYHRDLKPENILCFDDGLRLAITDFGLATTDRMSTEFRTGSVYHMSPECQGGEFAPTKSYSPLANDIWSLGIILLNLITGRNPWKSASADDCTFQAYLRDPSRFLPTVLPISDEVNALLVRTLAVDWRHRISLRDMRIVVKSIRNFYSDDVLFEDSMARCPWEAGIRVEEDEEEVEESATPSSPHVIPEAIPDPDVDLEAQDFHDTFDNSRWSNDSDPQMVLTKESWGYHSSFGHDSLEVSPNRSETPSPPYSDSQYSDSRSASGVSAYSASSLPPSPPVTPGPDAVFFGETERRQPGLRINTDVFSAGCYPGSVNMLSANMLTATESAMQTALDSGLGNTFGSWYYESEKPSAIDDTHMDLAPYPDDEEDEAMESGFDYTPEEFPSGDVARPESPVLGLDGLSLEYSSADLTAVEQSSFDWSNIPSAASSVQPTPASDFSFLNFTPNVSGQAPNFFSYAAPPATSFETTLGPAYLDPPSHSGPSSTSSSTYSRSRSRSRKSRIFMNPVRLAFTRRSRSPTPPPPPSPPAPAAHIDPQKQPLNTHWTLATSISPYHPPFSCLATPAQSPQRSPAAVSTAVQEKNVQGIRRRQTRRRLRSWFSSKLFPTVLSSSA